MVTAWWSDLPGTRVPEHMHDFPETRWVLAGFLKVTTPEGAYELGPGDRLDLPAETRHACEVVGLSPAIYVTGTSDQRAAPAFAITNT
jgi:quercetin dioxygenase-like cupin family protein